MRIRPTDVGERKQRRSPRWPLSYPDYIDWQSLNKSFSSLDMYNGAGYILNASSGAEPVQAERVSGGFFQTLGVHPMLGRDFYPDENRPGGPNVLLLSYGAWLHRFGAGAMPWARQSTWMGTHTRSSASCPAHFSSLPAATRSSGYLSMASALTRRCGLSITLLESEDCVTASSRAARAEMTAIAKQLRKKMAKQAVTSPPALCPSPKFIVGNIRPILLALFGGAVLLLLIACVNVASLVLVRSESRRREAAVRGALGATRGRLAGQFVAEGLLLAVFGSVAGVIVAAGV